MNNRWMIRPFYAPADDGVAGGSADKGAPDGGEAKSPEKILFPDDGKKPSESDGKNNDPNPKPDSDKKPDGEAAKMDWKEYVADPNKSVDENARLKVEHDKTKPADKKNDKTAADTVPEDGKYDLKMPDGVEVDQELLAALGPKFAAKKLTNAEAQQFADEFIKIQQARSSKQTKQWGETISKWVDDAKADKEIGGDKWGGTVKTARRAVDTLGTPALKEYLEVTGGGNHPEVIRFMAKVGAMIREDIPAAGGPGGSNKPADPAHLLFPNDAPKG